MGKPGKPMAKDANSKFTTRNNKQDIFSRFAKSSKAKELLEKRALDVSKHGEDNPNS